MASTAANRPGTAGPRPDAPARSRVPFLVVSAALFVMLMASNLATPLYAVYERRFSFPAVELTLIFATYAVVLVPSLLIFGSLSDRLGRRRVIAAGLSAGVISLALFASADAVPLLFAARAVQGLGTGLLSAAASAALVELEPSGHHGRAAVAIVLGNTGGSASGPLVAGALAQWAPDRLQLCFLVGIALLVLAFVGVLSVRDPVAPVGRWRLQRPSVPRPVLGTFARASVTGAAVWAVGALFLSVVPSYASELLRTGNLALLGAIAALMLASACSAQLLLLRIEVNTRVAQGAGLAAVAVGVGLLVAAFPLRSLPVVLAAAILAGLGQGVALLGAQMEINLLAPGERRGEAMAAFITCLYAGVAVATVVTGLLADGYGLRTAVEIIGGALSVVALIATSWHLMSG